jgi:hypothetical protein
MRKIALAASLLALSLGCASRIEPPDLMILGDNGSLAPAAWAGVLSTYVDEKGAVDFRGLSANAKGLEVWVRYVADTSPENHPELFPTPQSRLAYYLNAYNALAMYAVIHTGKPGSFEKVNARSLCRATLEIGHRWMSLYELEDRVIRPMGEPRVHFALNCMARGCPRLPREPFEAARLEGQLDSQAREFFADSRNVQVLTGRRVVRFSAILQLHTGDFLKKSPSLIDYANTHRTEKIPADFKVEFFPFDWTLNQK